MSSLGSPNPFFIAGKKAYEVERSLRFNDNDSAELNKTFSSAGNRKKWTWSAWVKRANLNGSGTQQTMFSGGSDSSNFTSISIYQDSLTYKRKISGSNDALITTTQKLRDVSAWYHFVVYEDAANTVTKFYINNVEVTDFSSSNQPSNVDGFMNTNQEHAIGNAVNTTELFDGYMTEINFIDGQAYDPSYFGKTDPLTGQWIPKKYVGSYGTNGFYLNFSDNSGTTATTLGKDYSGNGNNFTPNNFVTGDAVKDSPTNNFAVLRTHSTPEASGVALAEGNLKYTTGSSGGAGTQNRIAISTFLPTSGKWYAEVMATSSSGNQTAGIIPYAVEESPTTDRPRYNIVNFNTGQILKNLSGSGTTDTYGASISTNEVLCIYMDMDAKTVYYGKNGQWGDGSGSWNQSTPTSGSALGNSFFNNKTGGHEGFGISIMSVTGGASITCTANFGQDSTFAGTLSAGGNADANGKGDFKYTVPANALAMCSANLPDPTIKLPNKHFDTVTYTGSGSGNQSITSLNFQPDWVWLKIRSAGGWHALVDSIRGVGKILASNETDAENNSSDSQTAFSAFLSNGFTVGYNTSWYVNGTPSGSSTQVAWNWNAGDTDGKTYTVTVVSDSGNKYRFDGYGTSAVTLDLAEGGTYIFNYPSAHPFRFSTTSDGTHGGGSEYTTGVVVNSSTQVQITVAASAPTLYYYCTLHSGMGGQVNTNSTLGSSNFDGSTQSTVKVNATAGFSITKYTGTGSTATVGHGLGVAPDVLIVKNRDDTNSWNVYHAGNAGSTPAEDFVIYLDQTSAKVNQSSNWNDTAPTSSVFTVGSSNGSNGSSDDMIAYCFSSVAGYSKFGSYIGNGNNDGPFVFTGFTPKWILMKCAGTTGNWVLIDTERPSGGNFINYNTLSPNLASAENSSGGTTNDILSNGFKIRGGTDRNINGQQHIYLAFAESPFKNARAR